MVLNKFKVVSSSLLITAAILHSGITYADDSEVFLGSFDYSRIAKPNILFLLDYSTSMRDITLPGTNMKRIEGLRDAVSETLLNPSLVGVRVGVMKYPDKRVSSDTSVGSAVKLVYPVVDIDDVTQGSAPESSARPGDAADNAHQTKINGMPNPISIDSNVMLMGNLKADYSGIEREFSLDPYPNDLDSMERYNNLFLLPDVANRARYSNAITNVCSLIIDEDGEECVPGLFTGTGNAVNQKNHTIENKVVEGETLPVVTGLNGTGYYAGYGDQALFIFKGVNIPDGATITKASLTVTPERDGFDKRTGASFCTGTSNAKGEAQYLSWRIASARNFPAPSTDSIIYNSNETISDFNFFPKEGSSTNSAQYYNILQTNTRYNNDPGSTLETKMGSPQDGATCWWQKDKKITVNITTAIQNALNIAKTDVDRVGTYVNNFKSAAALTGAPMSDLAIRFWTNANTRYSKPYHTIGEHAPKLKLTYASNQNGTSDAAVRFNNIAIPQGATITSAKIRFVPAGGNDKDVTLRIRGQKIGDAPKFKATKDDFSTRVPTSSSVNWEIKNPWKTNAGTHNSSKYENTPELKELLQEMVNNPDWCGGQSMAFLLDYQKGEGYRSAFTYGQSSSDRPILEFEFTGGESGCLTQGWSETLSTRTADGYQVRGNSVPVLSDKNIYVYNNYLAGGYFSNVLLKNPDDVGLGNVKDKGLVSAFLQVVPVNNNGGVIKIALDNAIDADRIKAARNNLGERALLNVAGGTNAVAGTTTCTIPANSRDVPILCDISNLIRAKIQQKSATNNNIKWQNGNAITVIIEKASGSNMRLYAYDAGFSKAMKINIIARKELMAPNSLTIRKKIVSAVNIEEATIPQTPTMPAMLEAAKYITDIKGDGLVGPSQGIYTWEGKPQPSPLLSSCQMTHLILMSDGQANVNHFNWRRALVSYTGKPYRNSQIDCEWDGRVDGDGRSAEACGQSLVNFLSTINQGDNGSGDDLENKVITHAVAFGDKRAATFLERLVLAGDKDNRGRYFYATSSQELVDAFMDIMDTAKGVFYNYASGQVAVSNTNSLDQRREIYYSLMEPSNRNHWSGNMKRFGLAYKNIGGQQRAILVDSYGAEAVSLSSNGTYFINPLSTSWWSSQGVNEADGGDVNLGGVLDRLDNDPAKRVMYVMKDNSKFEFSAKNVAATGNNKITPEDLQVPAEEDASLLNLTKGYVNFLRGYDFNENGTASLGTAIPKKELKLGDFAHSAVTFLTYDQCKVPGQESASIIECDSEDSDGKPKFLGTGLEQIALLAGNDGFFRAFDVRTGNQVYAVIPNEMLELIPLLEKREAISKEIPRLYGLDGTIAIFHDDKTKDGYINGSDEAIAYVSAGRGGRGIYAIDIKNSSSPTLKWKKVVTEGKISAGFESLGYTWSTPVTGKMRWNNAVRNVVIFGGGYDPEQDKTEVRQADTMGNAIYILDAITGDIIWKADQNTHSAMRYSIPSPVAVYKGAKDGEGNDLITDIVVGDMGGQLWRFHINNSGSMVADGNNGVIAKVGADNNKAAAQRIYMAPAISKLGGTGFNDTLSVNIGTGYLGHPLVDYNEDQFYSFRISLSPDTSGTGVIDPNSLRLIDQATLTQIAAGELDLSTDNSFKQYGFRINLGGKGEKMISPLMASFDTVMFNTYMPGLENRKVCRLASGTQRSYSINLLTGESYFDTLYRTSDVIGLPPGVAMYCDSSACTPVHNFEDLTGEGSSHIFDRTPPRQGYIKTGWTDLFDLSPN